jgi:hypothetical protein
MTAVPGITPENDTTPERNAERTALLLKNGLPNLPASLVEAYRSSKGRPWRIKFAYETSPALSMEREQAARMAGQLRAIGDIELADEIDHAVTRAVYYGDIS